MAFASSITEVFFIASMLMGIAFIVSLFLKEIALRKTHAPLIEKVGKELAAEEGTLSLQSEPTL